MTDLSRAVVKWLRCDLRLADHPALQAAADEARSLGRPMVPLFVAEGWMHNRVRMLVASFLAKDLHLPWQRGAAHFLALLIDGDLASNNHGWQWVTGTDAAPFHRVFSPDRQAERFDPAGDYVARYVPEHGSAAYPDPIVDHAVERAEALGRWEEARESAASAEDGRGARATRR